MKRTAGSTHTDVNRTYSIMEAAKLSGLPETTLRYYETIGIIDPIVRDPSSKQRVYDENDINLIIAVACLSATGMSIKDMPIGGLSKQVMKQESKVPNSLPHRLRQS